jgi:hypothetical protein
VLPQGDLVQRQGRSRRWQHRHASRWSGVSGGGSLSFSSRVFAAWTGSFGAPSMRVDSRSLRCGEGLSRPEPAGPGTSELSSSCLQFGGGEVGSGRVAAEASWASRGCRESVATSASEFIVGTSWRVLCESSPEQWGSALALSHRGEGEDKRRTSVPVLALVHTPRQRQSSCFVLLSKLSRSLGRITTTVTCLRVGRVSGSGVVDVRVYSSVRVSSQRCTSEVSRCVG